MINFKSLIHRIVYSYFISRNRRLIYKYGLNHSAPARKLIKEELKEINNLWSGVGFINEKNSRCYDLLKTYGGGFNPKCISEELFNSYLIRSLNTPSNIIGYEHKGMYGSLLGGVNLPKTLLCRINGSYYDDKRNLISVEDVERVLASNDSVFVKATTFSNQGRGVRFYSNGEVSLSKLNARFGDDYIVQVPVIQSQKTKIFSKNSLNTFRISTLLINGHCSLCTILFRCGVGDSMVDNGFAGNIMVGVEPNGDFQEYGYDKWLNRHDCSDTGIPFRDCRIEEMKELVNIALSSHSRYLPLCGFVGWDWALDQDDQPVLIEVNLFEPGVWMEQLCARSPLFGERTEEVIAWVSEHKPTLESVMLKVY